MFSAAAYLTNSYPSSFSGSEERYGGKRTTVRLLFGFYKRIMELVYRREMR